MAALLAVGDVAAKRADMASIFASVADTLRTGDFVFGQLETTVSARGERTPHAKLAMRADPALAPALAGAGFNVMSFAGNHCMDWGGAAFDDTLTHMHDANVALCGAGSTLAAARAPAIMTSRGVRLAVLAYSSILPAGYAAEHDRPGCAPMRAYTHYEQIEPDQPGTPARIHTIPHAGDLAHLVEDVKAARARADVVALSIHWGIHMIPGAIADYQKAVAYAAIDAGADIILGHHPHILKAVEFYRGKAIFYSMGNFAIEQPQIWEPAIVHASSFKHLMALNPAADPGAVYVLPPDTRKTIIVKAVLSSAGVEHISVLPAWIDDTSTPSLLGAHDPRFGEVADYLRTLSADQGLNAVFAPRGDCVDLIPG